MGDIKQCCDLAGLPADRKCIYWLLGYFLFMAVALVTGFIMVWCRLQNAIDAAGVHELLNNVVATIGGDSLFAVKKVVAQTAAATADTATKIATEPTEEPRIKHILLISDSFAVLTVFISGAFGGFIHAARSFYYHVHQGDLEKSKGIELVLRPFTGATLALIFYLVLRAGLSQSPSQPGESGGSIIFYTAVAAIVGMFTDQTVAKLKKIAEAILTSPEKADKDKEAADANR